MASAPAPEMMRQQQQTLSAPRGVVSKSPLSVTYTVEGKTTIPTDGQSHKVLVASLPLEATVTHVTTPRKSTVAYLQVSDPIRSVEASALTVSNSAR